MADIRAICAIGQRGQLGLNGRLPWEGKQGREYVADVARFFEVTRGHVIIAGPRTIASIPRFAYDDRTICEIRSESILAEVLAGSPIAWFLSAAGRRCGRPMPPRSATDPDITRLPDDGEADRWFDPAWLVAAEK